jgi:hypothetical protein
LKKLENSESAHNLTYWEISFSSWISLVIKRIGFFRHREKAKM